MDDNGQGRTATRTVAALLVAVIVAATGGAIYFVGAGMKARRGSSAPDPAPAARPAAAPTRRTTTTPRPAASAPKPSEVPDPQPARRFDGVPLAWGCSRDQQILLQESPPQGGRTALIIMGTDFGIQGILFLNDTRPVLPSNFLVKTESWGEVRHFGGQDILLGIVAFKGEYDEPAFRRAAAAAGWWKGKARPAFQMGY